MGEIPGGEFGDSKGISLLKLGDRALWLFDSIGHQLTYIALE